MAQNDNSAERRKVFPKDIWESLKFYAADEKQNVSPEIRGMITPDTMAWEILKNHLTSVGHYPVRTGPKKKCCDDPTCDSSLSPPFLQPKVCGSCGKSCDERCG